NLFPDVLFIERAVHAVRIWHSGERRLNRNGKLTYQPANLDGFGNISATRADLHCERFRAPAFYRGDEFVVVAWQDIANHIKRDETVGGRPVGAEIEFDASGCIRCGQKYKYACQ